MTRSRGRMVLALVFALFACNAWAQVLFSEDPARLAALQFAIGLAGVVAALGSWVGARWAPAAALAHGGITAAMLVALPAILGLEPEARSGIWTGAAAALALGVWSAWYLRRVIRRDTAAATAAAAAR